MIAEHCPTVRGRPLVQTAVTLQMNAVTKALDKDVASHGLDAHPPHTSKRLQISV
jgi:hypothetical protein